MFSRGRKDMSVRLRILNRGLRINMEFWQNHRSASPQHIIAREQSISGWVPNKPTRIKAETLLVGEVSVQKITSPTTNNESVLLYFPGGGYVAGSPSTTHRDYIWRLAEAAKSQVWAVDYRKAPEHPFPAALDDAVQVYQKLLKQYKPSTIAVGGDSAGGGLAIALVLKLRDGALPLPSAVSVVSPWTDLTSSGDSIVENAETEVMVPAHLLSAVAKLYAGNFALDNPYVSPLFADFRNFPPTQILVSDAEILLDDSRRLFEKMTAAKVEVSLQVEPNLPHVWPVFARLLPESRKTIVQIGNFLAEHLGG